jgi:hypothetical protein
MFLVTPSQEMSVLLFVAYGYAIKGIVCVDVSGYAITRNVCAAFRSLWFCH